MTPAPSSQENQGLTPALEDYLESIFELIQEKGFARVKDIAKGRSVRAASVTPAMRRLDELGLISYARREYITLTPSGEHAARSIVARHRLLARFLHELLGVSPKQAQLDACAAEHSLSPEAMDRLVRFFEFVEVCPEGKTLVKRFNHCSLVHPGIDPCAITCQTELARHERPLPQGAVKPLSALIPGQKGRVSQIEGSGAIRQRLLDMGILPDTEIELERVAPGGDPLWIRLQGFQLSLRKQEASCVLIHET